jgi:SAM-dependent methyltransferase
VIANHMLYYAADVDKALAGIRRVLKRGGRLYASTNGLSHLQEVDALVAGFRGGSRPVASVMKVFNLENGQDYLERHFETVQVERQENSLLVDDPAVLAAFCLSMTRTGISEEERPAFVAFIEEEMRRSGGMKRVQKDGGLFVGARKRNI